MSVEIEELFDKHKGRTGYVCGLGPSLKKFLDITKKEIAKNGIIISCNEMDIMTDLIPRYWILANSELTIPVMHKRMAKYPKTTIIYADSIDYTDREKVAELLTNKYYGYDQRHMDSRSCGYPETCCKNIIPGRLTVMEHLMKKSGIKKSYGSGDTVALHMVSFAVLMGCNPIHIYGVDLDYRLGYVDMKSVNGDSFEEYLPRIIEGFQVIKECADSLGIEIIEHSYTKKLSKIFRSGE